jgi:hypothetical protein
MRDAVTKVLFCTCAIAVLLISSSATMNLIQLSPCADADPATELPARREFKMPVSCPVI